MFILSVSRKVKTTKESTKRLGSKSVRVIGVSSYSTQPLTSKDAKDKYKLVIVGGGTGGLAVASQVQKSVQDVCIIEPQEKHYYQPGWTLVGGGIWKKSSTERDEGSLIPNGHTWVKDKVSSFQPDDNTVTLEDGKKIGYDFLVVSSGIQINWNKIKGLEETLGKNGVCSNYSFDVVDKTWKFIQEFKGGRALFTQPNTPIKCGGAPQKIMYIAYDHWKRSGKSADISFFTGMPGIFPSPHYGEILKGICKERGIDVNYKTNLIAVDGDKKEATFMDLDSNKERKEKFDMIHVVPPMSAPKYIADSPISNEAGYVDVDKGTLQHNKYNNIFGLGDSSSLPTSKTAAAIASQAPIISEKLSALIENRTATKIPPYNGYTSCPIPTGIDKLLLAEFDYTLRPCETFGRLINQDLPRYDMFLMKTLGFPWMYWNGLVTGGWWKGAMDMKQRFPFLNKPHLNPKDAPPS